MPLYLVFPALHEVYFHWQPFHVEIVIVVWNYQLQLPSCAVTYHFSSHLCVRRQVLLSLVHVTQVYDDSNLCALCAAVVLFQKDRLSQVSQVCFPSRNVCLWERREVVLEQTVVQAWWGLCFHPLPSIAGQVTSQVKTSTPLPGAISPPPPAKYLGLWGRTFSFVIARKVYFSAFWEWLLLCTAWYWSLWSISLEIFNLEQLKRGKSYQCSFCLKLYFPDFMTLSFCFLFQPVQHNWRFHRRSCDMFWLSGDKRSYSFGDYHPVLPFTSRSNPNFAFLLNWLQVLVCWYFQCHVSVVPIYSCLKKRNLCEFSKTALLAILICVLTYTGTASFGYLTFGSRINEDILLSYEPSTDVLVAVILIAAKMYTTYPILLFVGR